MTSISSLVRPEILQLRPYESARSLTKTLTTEDEETLFLDANESPRSPLPLLGLNRYPEPQPKKLLDRFSHLYGVSPSSILMTRGSDEAIDLLVRTFCEPGQDEILICPPTYGMYEVSAKIQGAQIVRVPLQMDLEETGTVSLRVQEILQALFQKKSIKIVFLCTPNNPTGTALDPSDLVRIFEGTRGRCIVVLDEAYAEFANIKGEAYAEFAPPSSVTQALPQYPHLVILRTLSKAWALAGARMGVAIAQEELIQLLQKIRPPYPLSTPSILSALEATNPDHQEMLKLRVKTNHLERENLKTELLKICPVRRVFSSATNFLLVQFHPSHQIFNFLKANKIIVRDRSTEVGLNDCIRITVGTRDQNQRLLAALQQAGL